MANDQKIQQQRYRLVLIILTAIVTFLISVELISSWSQPKAQSQLNLYQSDLLLQASEWQPVLEEDQAKSLSNPLLDADPVTSALKTYRQVRTSVQTDLERIEQTMANASDDPATLAQQQNRSQFRDNLDLRIGLLLAQSDQVEDAIATWSPLTTSPTLVSNESAAASILIGLWSDPPQLLPNAQQSLKSQLSGWFEGQALERLFTLSQRQDDLTTLQIDQQVTASNALARVVTINGLTLVGNGVGVIILLVWLVRSWRQRAGNSSAPPSPHPLQDFQTPPADAEGEPTSDTPAIDESKAYLAQTSLANSVLWPPDLIWQVMVLWFIAFFGVSLSIPLLIYVLGIQPTALGARPQVYLAFSNYAILVVVGLTILIWSLKGFLSTPFKWFRIRWQGNWLVWGMSGYFAALPLVILIALLNQKVLGDQGGGNPLLELIIQSHDPLTASLLFIMVAGLAPFFEEILFRGFFLTSLTRYLPMWGAIGVSGIVFAIAHLNLADILPLSVLGCVLGFVYSRSRNLLASMLLHSLWNSGSFLSLLILGSSAR
ncbi:CPBP family intramembrane metalloprotease [Acaryochloris sp. 'Moss Beach']|uniref:CPBP family intramembrane glutamic endopeptidase n=1 Tax=Acaryochloris sp. 'Moss Beach' TaxID=2740837 RepID=UPI001F26FDD0|nr:type II CAAX endopeptidase family protein [Acaryochloris sp. 'Moss Beach']UJB67879.1 CPBP family intramembrane metalloprotease [Acaryochloris sp. 'Moss Beach']